jgi:predicted Zn-dependent protease
LNVTVSRRGLRFVAVILAATVAPLAAGMAQTQPGFDETEAARQKRLLEEQERAGAASQEVLPAADDISYADVLKDPDNIDLNFRYAKAQVARGNVRGAASTLERILLVTPDLPQVRLMYAIVLYRLDNIDEAEREFNALKELKMAGSLEAEIDRFLGAIKQRRQTTTARVQVSLGVKRDSNVNAGSRSGQALAAGLQFAPLGRAQKQDDFAAIGVVTADVTQDLGHQAPDKFENGSAKVGHGSGVIISLRAA